MQTQTTSAFTEQPSSPTVIIPSQQSTGRPSPTTGPITNPTPATPPYQQYQQQSQPFQQQQSQPFQQQQSAPYQQQQMQQSPQMNYGAPPPQSQATMNTLALISVIAGSLGLLTFCCYGLGIIPAAAGLIMGFVGLKKVQQTGERGRELAIAGMVTGGIGTLFGIVYLILIVIGVVSSSMR
jgi:hypothetical protein